MKALLCSYSLPRIAVTRLLGAFTPRAYVGALAPLALTDLPEPKLPRDDWVTLRTNLCGLCGSDYKQIFLKGSMNNPMTALISFPQVLGHEVVGIVDSVGAGVTTRRVGERVVLNPWLSCTPRGITPACEWCASGDYAQCSNFTRGCLTAGIHHGNSSMATGGFATTVAAHESQCIPVPEGIESEAAVLADPFSVSLHAILRTPPPAAGTVLVYGCGTLGLCSIAILHALYPRVRVLAVARFDHQRKLALELGADSVLAWRPTQAIIASISRLTDAEMLHPWYGQPMLNGGVDVVYDTVASAESLEVGVRVTRTRGAIVATGVEVPRKFEWTPLYFKEIRLVGSNAFGIEELDGRRQHAMAWYFELLRAGRIDLTPIITHRYALEEYREAFLTCWDQGRSGAVKVLFTFG
jgi:threonine dehydrogenase-like Zn-dependent dehydrogenase